MQTPKCAHASPDGPSGQPVAVIGPGEKNSGLPRFPAAAWLRVVPNQIGDAGRGKPTSLLVRHDNFVDGQCAAQLERGGGSGDQPGGDGPVVCGPDLDADGMAVRAGVDRRGEGTEGFGQDDVGSAVQDARDLCVSEHGHGGNDSLGGHLDELDAHLHDQRADTHLS